MSRTALFLRRLTYGAVSVTALLAACDREAPTDVAAPSPRANRVGTPSMAVNAAKLVSSYEVKTFGIDVVSGNQGVVEVLCTAGKRVLGGGYHIGGGALIDSPDVAVYESSPRVTSGTDGWRLEAMNRTADTRRLDVWVICAPM